MPRSGGGSAGGGRRRRQAPTPPRDSYVYGINPVLELLDVAPNDLRCLYLAVAFSDAERGKKKDGHRIAALRTLAQDAGVVVKEVDKAKIVAMVGDVVHQGVVAHVGEHRYVKIERLLGVFTAWSSADAKTRGVPPMLVALDCLQDPHNFGAIVRSAWALGAAGVIIPCDRAVQVTPVVVKSAAGATVRMPISRVTNLGRTLSKLKQAGAWVMGASPDGNAELGSVDMNVPLVLVIGAEGGGIRQGVAKNCDQLLSIPMPSGFGSLNASCAAAVFLYEAARQRR